MIRVIQAAAPWKESRRRPMMRSSTRKQGRTRMSSRFRLPTGMKFTGRSFGMPFEATLCVPVKICAFSIWL